MMSGRDPGALGIYGMRNRSDYSYDNLTIATGREVKEPRIWDLLSREGSKGKTDESNNDESSRSKYYSGDYSIVLGVPGTYPPTAINGDLVSGFLTPDTHSQYTHPPELADEIRSLFSNSPNDRQDDQDGYQIDVRNFRTDDKDRLLDEIRSMTRKRFALFRHLLRTRPWNFAIMVEMGPDRIHHGFWRYCDPDHRLHEPGNPYLHVIRDYYRMIDSEIAETLRTVWGKSAEELAQEMVSPNSPAANTAVMVVSDHGARALEGGFAFNEWLIREGYLVLKEGARTPAPYRPDPARRTSTEETSAERIPLEPSSTTRIPLEPSMIDWPRTRTWGEGGYYGRLFLNIQGREPQGTVPAAEAESLLAELEEKLTALPDDRGQPMGNVVCRPSHIYKGKIKGIPPDLMIYFGNLAWRSIGSIVSDTNLNDQTVTSSRTGTADSAGAVDPAGADTPGSTGPGTESLYTPENDTGPDDANHDWNGIFIAAGGSIRDAQNIDLNDAYDGCDAYDDTYINDADILDIAPTVLHLLGKPIPDSMQGKVLL